METNKPILLIIFIIIMLFTEIMCINIEIAFNYLPIVFYIISFVMFTILIKRKINNKKDIVILNIIILVINWLLAKFITFGYIPILAILIFCIKLKKLEFNESFIKFVLKYYIIPLGILLIINKVYLAVISEISDMYDYFLVDYIYLILNCIYTLLVFNSIIIISYVLYKDNFKILFSINSKYVFIISSIIIIIILLIKIIIGCINLNEAKNNIYVVNNVIQANDINEFYSLSLESSIDADNISESFEKLPRYLLSINNVLIKGQKNWADSSYILGTNDIEELVRKRTMTKKEALKTYIETSENYIDYLSIYTKNLKLQNIVFFIIYFIDIISVYIVYKNLKNNNESIKCNVRN